MIRARRTLLCGVLVVLSCALAWAHKPLFGEEPAASPERALMVKDPGVSQVTYHEVTTETPTVWLTFELAEGQEVFLQIGVPVLERLKDYRPAIALVGPGLPAAELPFELPEGLGAVVFATHEVTEPRYFYEPFTGTASWILRDARHPAPVSGRYYAVAFDPEGRPGKLWLAIGEREEWTPADFAAALEWRGRIRQFHEVPPPPQ